VVRELLKLEKKMREIDQLRQRQEQGEELDPKQVEKLSRAEQLKEQLHELRLARDREENPSEDDQSSPADPGHAFEVDSATAADAPASRRFVLATRPPPGGMTSVIQQDYHDEVEEVELPRPMLVQPRILVRPQNAAEQQRPQAEEMPIKTMEQKRAEYAAARARIFGDSRGRGRGARGGRGGAREGGRGNTSFGGIGGDEDADYDRSRRVPQPCPAGSETA
jgi:hypothetical protein